MSNEIRKYAVAGSFYKIINNEIIIGTSLIIITAVSPQEAKGYMIDLMTNDKDTKGFIICPKLNTIEVQNG